jgi:Putative adhesin
MVRAATLTLLTLAALQAADSKDVNKTVALTPNGAVTIETHKGSIHVTTWDRPEVDIKARIEAESGTTMDRRRFDATEVRIDATSDSVHIRTQYPDWCCNSDDEGNNPEVRYTIQMPRTGRLTIHDHRSETDVADLSGALDITTHRGTVRVHRLAGPLQLTTHRGEVNIEFASFTANSVIDTYRGSVELSMPRNSRFDLQADLGRHATVDTDFTMMTRSADRRGETMHGSVNGGGPTLDVKTYRGDIRLRSR